jgi:hypothetical protein
MSTPLFSVHVWEVFPRAALFDVTPMASNIIEEELTNDFGLQLLLEGYQRYKVNHVVEEAIPQQLNILEELYKQMLPCSITLPENDPNVPDIMSSRQCDGRQVLSITHLDNGIQLELERNYTGFCNAAEYYIYYMSPVTTDYDRESDGKGDTLEEVPSSLRVAIVGKYPWLISFLQKGMLWESAAYSFSRYTH